jgi:formate-dependent nitrite reductase membrane component NrfD
LLGELLVLIPFEVLPSATPTAPGTGVYPAQGQGFAAYLVGGFFGLGLIILAMVLLGLKPKRADPDQFRR